MPPLFSLFSRHGALRVATVMLGLASALALSGCGKVCGNGKVETGEACDDGNRTSGDGCENDCTASPAVCGNGRVEAFEQCDDGNTTGGDGCEANCTTKVNTCGNGKVDGEDQCDDGNTTGGDGCEADCTFSKTGAVLGCPGMNLAPPATGTCTATAGDKNTLITGIILADGKTYLGGQVLVDDMGLIACTGCDCSTAAGGAGATKLVCPQGVVSPGLINSHDHISFQANPYVGTDERYEHRHDWRKGNDGHTLVNNGGNATNAQVRWAELRNIMAGTTSTVGATYTTNGNSGLLRNLDTSAAGQLGLNDPAVVSDTFPLGDSGGTELTTGCGYPKVPTSSVVPADSAYLPHVAEGIEASAQNEFTCLSQANGVGIMGAHTAIVHGIALRASDISLVAQTGTSLVWSPRSNVSLYGDTASIPLYARLGVNIALGTDWTISGSMNLLRELQCADSLNKNKFKNALSDEQLWRTVTANAADATAKGAQLGRLQKGLYGDVAIFKQHAAGATWYRSIIDAAPADVVLTMRGGKVLYGDAPLVAVFDSGSMCETLDVCGTSKAACVKGELPALTTGTNAADTLDLLKAANANTYPLFFCGAVMNEPSCVPERAMRNIRNSSSVYTATAAADDKDGDGVADSKDNCPDVFNPIRPMDNGMQANADGDAAGDACDVCPLDKDTSTCKKFDANDRDSDGKPNTEDNCPTLANADQADADSDGKGDVCDPCPNSANPGTQACVATIYAIKSPTSTLTGQSVSLNNVLVTGVAPVGFFLQVPETDSAYMGAAYSGVYAYSPSSGLTVGDRISVNATTPTNFHGQIQLSGITPVANDAGTVIVTSGNALPAPIDVNPADIATNDGGLGAQLEGVLVRISNVEVLNIAPDAGAADTAPINEFVVTGDLRVNDLMTLVTPFPTVGQRFNSITGIVDYRNGFYKLEPRSAADVALGPASVAAIEPAEVFIRVGSSTTIPAPLTVRLSNPDPTDVVVTLSASAIDVTVPATVTVPANQTTAVIPVTGITANNTGVTVTATRNDSTKTALVRVIGPTDVASLVSLSPANPTVSPGGKVTFTVKLDLPAPSPTVVTLALNPASGFGTAPATVTVPQDQLSATFEYVAPGAAAMGTLTATLGSASFTSNVKVDVLGAAHMVISEAAVKGAAGAGDEFVELYNPTSEAVDISGWKVQYKAVKGTSWLTKATVPANISIPPHQYYLVASKTYPGEADLKLDTDLSLSATAGHLQIVDDQGVGVDKVAWGPTTDPTAATTPIDPEGAVFVVASFTNDQTIERKATVGSTAASMAVGGADEKRGNGIDTDNNANDFVLRGLRDPQSLQSGVTEP